MAILTVMMIIIAMVIFPVDFLVRSAAHGTQGMWPTGQPGHKRTELSAFLTHRAIMIIASSIAMMMVMMMILKAAKSK